MSNVELRSTVILYSGINKTKQQSDFHNSSFFIRRSSFQSPSSLFILISGIKGPKTGIQPIVRVSENY